MADTKTEADQNFYTVKDGDTWGSLAARFYGNSSLGRTLAGQNGANEDSQPAPGAEILVPRRGRGSRRGALERGRRQHAEDTRDARRTRALRRRRDLTGRRRAQRRRDAGRRGQERSGQQLADPLPFLTRGRAR